MSLLLIPSGLVLQVEHAAVRAEGMSFRNAWVKQLAVRLPTLALAVDDTLLVFIERVIEVLNIPPPPLLTPQVRPH